MSVEQKQFQTEVSQLLDIVIHSLYSNKEIFLRELISNASDAIDKAKYEGITNAAIYEGDTDWRIKLSYSTENGTLTISDNGIGMNREEIVKVLGTIAHSGTREFIKKMQENKADASNLIGQFGLGFYSAYMAADNVEVHTRRRGDSPESGTLWKSDGKSEFTVEELKKDTPGTDITLHMREDSKSILNEWGIKRIVTTYSDYIEYPVLMDVEHPVLDAEGKSTEQKEVKEETLNSMKALWLKDKAEITPAEQNQFYKHITHDFADPMKTIQFKVEGTSEFFAMLFIPAHAPFDMFYKDMKFGPMLYVRRVQIMEHCEELLPHYLRFIKGVVESNDLPLNVSREILQHNKQIPVIQKTIVRKTLEVLAQMQKEEPETYKKFYQEFGKVLKEGVHYDYERKEQVAKLLMFESSATKAGEYTTFEEYVSRMKAEQKDIYFITGISRADCENSPYIEGLKQKGYEVLYMTDEFDDIIFSGLGTFDGKAVKSALKGDLDIDEEVKAQKTKQYKELVDIIKQNLGDKVADVRLTTRLKDSPVCLVTDEGAPDPQMERLLKAMGQEVPKIKRTLEINPDHALLKAMKKALSSDEKADKKLVNEYSALLYSQAVLLEGGHIDNMAEFINKMSKMMADKLKG